MLYFWINYIIATIVFFYFSVVSMGICSLIVTVVLYITETIYFRAATFNFYVVFPCILNGKVSEMELYYYVLNLYLFNSNNTCGPNIFTEIPKAVGSIDRDG